MHLKDLFMENWSLFFRGKTGALFLWDFPHFLNVSVAVQQVKHCLDILFLGGGETFTPFDLIAFKEEGGTSGD